MGISALELLLRPSSFPLTPSKCSLVVCDWVSAFLQRTLRSAGRWVSLNCYSTLLVPSWEIKNGSNCLIGSLPDFSSWPPQFSVNVARANLFSFGFHPPPLQSGCCTNCSKRAPFSLLLSLLSSPTSPSCLERPTFSLFTTASPSRPGASHGSFPVHVPRLPKSTLIYVFLVQPHQSWFTIPYLLPCVSHHFTFVCFFSIWLQAHGKWHLQYTPWAEVCPHFPCSNSCWNPNPNTSGCDCIWRPSLKRWLS